MKMVVNSLSQKYNKISILCDMYNVKKKTKLFEKREYKP